MNTPIANLIVTITLVVSLPGLYYSDGDKLNASFEGFDSVKGCLEFGALWIKKTRNWRLFGRPLPASESSEPHYWCSDLVGHATFYFGPGMDYSGALRNRAEYRKELGLPDDGLTM